MNKFLAPLAAAFLMLAAPAAQAGIFDLPTFLEPGDFSVGLEPEVALSQGTGAALNLKPRWGQNDILNWQGLIGTGAGDRKFRIGLTAAFEWFPNVENQPGIATPLFMEYYRRKGDSELIFGAKPMVYKKFEGAEADFTPFIAVPVGWSYRSDNLKGYVQVALGTNIEVPSIEKWSFSGEIGFNAANAYTYLSGGVTYYP